jgi:hypothetical protein
MIRGDTFDCLWTEGSLRLDEFAPEPGGGLRRHPEAPGLTPVPVGAVNGTVLLALITISAVGTCGDRNILPQSSGDAQVPKLNSFTLNLSGGLNVM